jgi:arylsulfatase A-like enzyme
LTHVPLIIRCPWNARPRRIKPLVQSVDIVPTIVDLLGIPVPAHAQGKSLAGLVNGARVPAPHDYIYGKMHYAGYIRDKDWLLIEYDDGPRTELYDLKRDPGEHRNIYPGPNGIGERLKAAFREWEKSLPSYRDEEYSFPPEFDEATRERIRKTGYW